MEQLKNDYHVSSQRPFDIKLTSDLYKIRISELKQLLEEGYQLTCSDLRDELDKIPSDRVYYQPLIELIPTDKKLIIPITLARDVILELQDRDLVDDYTLTEPEYLDQALNAVENIDLLEGKIPRLRAGLLANMLTYVGVKVDVIPVFIKHQASSEHYSEIIQQLRDSIDDLSQIDVNHKLMSCIMSMSQETQVEVNFMDIIARLIDVDPVSSWKLIFFLDRNNHIQLENYAHLHWSIERLVDIKQNRKSD